MHQQQVWMNMEHSTIQLLHELQNDLLTPQTHNQRLPPAVVATLNDFVAISDIPKPNAMQDNPLPPTTPQISPLINRTNPPSFSELSPEKQIKITQRLLRVGELTNLLEEAIKTDQPTEVIAQQLIQEGIDPEAVAQKIATYKSNLSN